MRITVLELTLYDFFDNVVSSGEIHFRGLPTWGVY